MSMNLESRRVRKSRETAEEFKDLNSVKDLKKSIESLLGHDIDQEWIKENEGKEFSFSPRSTKENTEKSNLKTELESMKRLVNSLPKKDIDQQEIQKLQDIYMQIDEPEKLENKKIESFDTQESDKNKDFESGEVQPEAVNAQQTISEGNGNDLHDPEPITSSPSIETVKPVIEEMETRAIIDDNSALIEELGHKIDKKYKRLIAELSNLYSNEVLDQEANNIMSDLQSLIDIKDRSLEELKRVDATLNNIITRFVKLSQKAQEAKASADFHVNQQIAQMRKLEDYQIHLQKNYGKYWFNEMTSHEKETYIELYASAHEVSRESVEKQITDSIRKANSEITEEKKQREQQQASNATTQIEPKEQPFKGEYENVINYNIRYGVNALKQIHAILTRPSDEPVTSQHVDEFKYFYSTLSKLSKIKPNNSEEEQQKLNQSYEITEKIDQLLNSLNDESEMSM